MQKLARILGAGVVFGIIALIIHTLFAFVSMDFYGDPAYLPVWSKLMMPTAGPPPASFLYYSLSFNIISGILFALVYTVIGSCVPGERFVSRGLMYGFLIFLVGAIPGYFALYLLINLPTILIALWAVESLLLYLIGGIVVAKLISTYLFLRGLC
ncbi:MAG: hypothetical protein EFT35_03565 [Methanophagales archaeon ANME-1-THS]|nr:MAG: hypothetical protein EFT35_03565 [Methanophagales archaeon ANME-1-THS]